jgi:hypothetical protein
MSGTTFRTSRLCLYYVSRLFNTDDIIDTLNTNERRRLHFFLILLDPGEQFVIYETTYVLFQTNEDFLLVLHERHDIQVDGVEMSVGVYPLKSKGTSVLFFHFNFMPIELFKTGS